ncbi:uncharacterized protein LOC132620010 [Lycium barbarum]|uniref:uncharacterized protein LOC132620010 n=1 Tax=Lycium barbarum TaxID=112863 RepID=UPI00293E4F78|nr:uncharacterized protein LOC132620010 [Lycium barbarum]
MIKVNLFFHHGGDWIREPHVLYEKKWVHYWREYDLDLLSYIDIVNEYTFQLGFVGVQQLIVARPSEKYFELEGDEGIRKLLSFVSEEYHVIHFFATDECEIVVHVPNILQSDKSFFLVPNFVNEAGTDAHVPNVLQNDDSLFLVPNFVTEVGTDCSDTEDDNGMAFDCPEYDSEELERLATHKRRAITENLNDFRELVKGMTFKDIPEARNFCRLYALANKKELVVGKSDTHRVRYSCDAVGCPFICHISDDDTSVGVTVKTLIPHSNCGVVYDNPLINSSIIAQYFKGKLQDDPKYKIKDMRADLHRVFDLNVSEGKCKRAKREVLETLEGSFTDNYKKLEAYANELRESNPGSDVVINLSKEALAQGKRKFLRMYICFKALKMGFKEGLRPFIGLDGTFLKGKAKGQVLVAIGQDSMNQFYPLAWAVVDKETKRTWSWFLQQLQHSLELHNGKGITFISDM